MSIIKKIKIKNFKKFGAEGIEIPFSNTLNVIVGKNEEGKSTILEAIHLALSGAYRGRSIKYNLSEDLFNIKTLADYYNSFEDNKEFSRNLPPEIVIEVFFSSNAETARNEGDNNEEGADNVFGVVAKIKLDEKYEEDYFQFVMNHKIQSLPIEFYTFEWRDFARHDLTSYSQKVKSFLIDSTNYQYQNGSDIYISNILRDFAENEDKVKISQAYRLLKDDFAHATAVREFDHRICQQHAGLNRMGIGVRRGGQIEWKNELVMKIAGVPYEQRGKGTQCAIKTVLALNHKNAQNADVILMEEPENHLTHANLNKLLNAIETSANKQIIVTTHSSFVANKIGIHSLILLRKGKCIKMPSLESFRFFQKLPGYDTLRLLLAKACILVEGDSDELIVQKAYMKRRGVLPIQDGIDVISVGNTFLRFLEIASKLRVKTAVVIDNDGYPERVKDKFHEFEYSEVIGVFTGDLGPQIDLENCEHYNNNTLEPELLRANKASVVRKILEPLLKENFPDVTDANWEAEIRLWMMKNKTECAMQFFSTDEEFVIPQYIQKAIEYVCPSQNNAGGSGSW